jgi:hypothetical protein
MTQPPFCNQPDDTASMVAQMYVQRQRQSVAAIAASNGCSTMGPPLPLVVSAPVSGKATLTVFGKATLTVEATIVPPATQDSRERPLVAEFLLRLFATSVCDESYIGCIYERFDNNCAAGSHARARSLFWADTLGYLLQQLPRAIKWAAILGAIKRYLGG